MKTLPSSLAVELVELNPASLKNGYCQACGCHFTACPGNVVLPVVLGNLIKVSLEELEELGMCWGWYPYRKAKRSRYFYFLPSFLDLYEFDQAWCIQQHHDTIIFIKIGEKYLPTLPVAMRVAIKPKWRAVLLGRRWVMVPNSP